MPKKSAIAEILGHDLDGHYVEYKVKTVGGAVKTITDWDFQTKKEEKLLAAYREKVTKKKDNPDADFTVEKIVTHRIVDGYPLYLVQWEGWPNPVSNSEMWEDDMPNCKSILAEYKKTAGLTKPEKKVTAKTTKTSTTSSRKRRARSPSSSRSPSPSPAPAPKKAAPKTPKNVVKKAKKSPSAQVAHEDDDELDDDLEGIEESHEVVAEPSTSTTPSRLMGMFSAVRSTFGW